MSSQINYSSVNANYPVAGQDNDSQGFRDNFSAIKFALNTASNEITNLQTVTAKLGTSNNFQGGQITNALVYGNKVLVDNSGNTGTHISGDETIYYGQADYVVRTLADTSTITISGWPQDGNLGYITLELYQPPGVTADPTSTVPDVLSVSFVGGTLKTDGPKFVNGAVDLNGNAPVVWDGSLPYVSSSTGVQIWDLWSHDSGATVYASLRGVWS